MVMASDGIPTANPMVRAVEGGDFTGRISKSSFHFNTQFNSICG